jgi:hypothetical protein
MNENQQHLTCSRCGAGLTPTSLQGLCPRCLWALNLGASTEIAGDTHPSPASAGTPPPPSPTPSLEDVARLFPQLEIVECLGRGGMGAVYKARQPRLDRWVALKILLCRQADGTADATFAERFAREARALARLNHPDIVAVYDYGEAGPYPYLLMEFVDGLTLRQLLQRGKLAPEEALAIVPKICAALQFAHQQGIVHRDIKPENILVDKLGQVKIADFGIAKILAPGAQNLALTGGHDVVGTPHYMAPEQVEQPSKVDHRADIFSLGVVLYEMLTGELPLGNFAPPSRKVQVDVRLDEVVLRALEKEPERRYQNAHEIKTDVETIARTPTPPPPAEASPNLEAARWRRIVVVGRRGNRAVLHWPGIVLSFILTLGAMVALAIGISLALEQRINPRAMQMAFFAAAMITGIRVRRGRTLPVEQLLNLDLSNRKAGEAIRMPWRRDWVLGLGTALVVLLALTVVTLSLPKSYIATARVSLTSHIFKDTRASDLPGLAATERQFLLRSPNLLSEIKDKVDLQARWIARFGKTTLSDPEMRAFLRELVRVRMLETVSFEQDGIRRQPLLEIQFWGDAPIEAAKIANILAACYCQSRTNFQPQFVDPATPPLRAQRPNLPLNLVVSAGIGLGLGLLATGVARWSRRYRGDRRETGSAPAQAAAPALRLAWIRRWMAPLLGTLVAMVVLALAIILLPSWNSKTSSKPRTQGPAQASPQEPPDAMGGSPSPRGVVTEWLRRVKAGRQEAWDLTTRGNNAGWNRDLVDLWEFNRIRPAHQLGNREQAMVVSNAIHDNSGRKRVFYAVLVHRDGQWKIDRHDLVSADNVSGLMEGFKIHPGVQFDVLPEELVGEWGAPCLSLTLAPDGTGVHVQLEPKPAGQPDSLRWEVSGASLRIRWDHGRESLWGIVRVDGESFQVDYTPDGVKGQYWTWYRSNKPPRDKLGEQESPVENSQ